MYKFIFSIILLFMIFIFPTLSYADDVLDRCDQYREQVVSLLESEEVDSNYFFLGVCESRCKLDAKSKSGAHGFFQVTKPTYNKYRPEGCRIDDISDLRCNVIAAARYIKHLQKRFYTLNEVIYAYNMGGHNFERRGSPSSEAKGLVWCVNNRIKEDKNR